MTKHVLVPHTSLSAEALAGVVDEFITREGTDYGHQEFPLEKKRQQVMRAIAQGQVLIVFDVEAEAVTLISKDESSSQNTPED